MLCEQKNAEMDQKKTIFKITNNMEMVNDGKCITAGWRQRLDIRSKNRKLGRSGVELCDIESILT